MSQHLFTEKDTYDSIINVEANGTSPRLQVEPAASDNLFRDASAQGFEDEDPFVVVSHHIKTDITQELGDGRIRLAHFKGAFFGAVFNLSNATIGTGVLGMELFFFYLCSVRNTKMFKHSRASIRAQGGGIGIGCVLHCGICIDSRLLHTITEQLRADSHRTKERAIPQRKELRSNREDSVWRDRRNACTCPC